MTDDPKNPFGQPPTSPIQSGQEPSQGGFGQPGQPQNQDGYGYGQPPAQQQQQPQQPPQQQPGFGAPPPGYQQPQGGFGQPQGGFGGQAQGGFGGQGQGGFGMPQQGGFIAPAGAQGGPPELPTGLKITSIVLLILAPVLTLVGLIPCLGILNWLAFPLNCTLALIGTLGLVIGPKLGDGKPANMNLHIAAIVVGVIVAAVSFFRCIAGGGVA